MLLFSSTYLHIYYNINTGIVSGGYMKSSARVIADSIVNLSKKRLIDTSKS